MIALLLALTALGNEVDVEDLGHWQRQTDVMLQGPEGCWAFTGGGVVKLALYTPASAFSRAGEKEYSATGTFSGILREGIWTELKFEDSRRNTSAEDTEGTTVEVRNGRFDMEFEPSLMFGKRPKRDGGEDATAATSAAEAANFVDRLLERIDPSITTSYAQWDADHTVVEFVQSVPFSEKARSKEVVLRTLFPEGGAGTAVDAIFPRRINLTELAEEDGDKPPFKIVLMDAQAHLRSTTVNDVVLPGAETMSAIVGALGFTIGWEQRVVYKSARECTAEEAAREPDTSQREIVDPETEGRRVRSVKDMDGDGEPDEPAEETEDPGEAVEPDAQKEQAPEGDE